MSILNNVFGKQEHKGGLKQILELAKPALQLTSDQEQKITEIFKSFQEERRGLKSGGDANAQDEIRVARQHTMQKIKAVLSDDQKKIFEENIAKWRQEVR